MVHTAGKKMVVLIPYFGPWPEWINLFLESCKFNPAVEWRFFTDNEEPGNTCPNVQYIRMSWKECRQRISERLHVDFHDAYGIYKLCDVKPAFGEIFAEHIEGYDFWGFGDTDVIYGDMARLLPEEAFRNDLITFNASRVNGHLCFLRNTPGVTGAFRRIKDWKKQIESLDHVGMDENHAFYGITRVYAKESFNTPLSPYLPWRSGKYVFPAEWYWKNGSLTNNLDRDAEFLYLHFMRLKYYWNRKAVHHTVGFDYRDAPHGWKIDLTGFSALPEHYQRPNTVIKIVPRHPIFHQIRIKSRNFFNFLRRALSALSCVYKSDTERPKKHSQPRANCLK